MRFNHKTVAFLSLVSLISVAGTAESQITNSEYAARRTALAQKLQNGILVALGSPEPEEDYISFNQNSQFSYLTGFNEPNAALLMVIRNGAISGTPMLFVQPSDPAREVWTGHRLGVAGAKTTLGFDGRSISTLKHTVDSLAAIEGATTLYTVGNFNGDIPLSHDDQTIA